MSGKPRRELKSLYPYTGATTIFQSSLEALLLLRQSPPQAGVSVSEKPRRELKSMYPTTGATTIFQSSLEALLLLRQSPPQAGVSVSKKPRRELKSLYPYTGATTIFQSSLEALLLLRQSPPSSKGLSCTKNRVGGKRSSFLPTFVFRPLTPPYVRFRIRRFLILRAV